MELTPTAVDTLSGSVEHVTFHNPENGFAVLKVQVPGRRELATVVGHMAAVAPGEYLEASGEWVLDRTHGSQFKAASLRTVHPSTRRGIEKYLGSGLIKGIGPHLAARLVELFGDQVFTIIEHQPQRLTEVHGIGRTRAGRIQKSWASQRKVREIMVFLHTYGVGSARAMRIHKTYGDEAVAIIQSNPYRLSNDIRGIGFKTADELAARLGVARDSPLRAQAGVAHVLRELTVEGHCAYPEEDLVEKAAELLALDAAAVRTALEHEIRRGRLIREVFDDTPWIYLEALHRAEIELADRARKIQSGAHPLPSIDVEKALVWVEQRVGLTLAGSQREAVRLATRHKLLIITGGPGVGKTTIVDSILRIFAAKELSCVLCAPTGRAAKRLSEATGRQAKTIHRLLEFDPVHFAFNRDATHPLEGDLVLIDEVSMMDLPLAAAILQAAPVHAAVILVGDVDQLPSVGPGNVLADLIASEAVPTVRLTEVFRQAAQSQIVRAAHHVNAGRVPDLDAPAPDSDFYFIPAEDPQQAVQRIVRVVAERIPQRFGLDPFTDIQVLSPMHRGLLGARNLNQVLQAALNPKAPGKLEIDRFGYVFRTGDKVLQTENDYEKQVYNGDLGIIETIDEGAAEVVVQFDGRPVVYAAGELDALAPAYVMTVHKSQGSEFPAVVIPVHTQHFIMLQRNLLYTAITRARRLVVLVGMPRAVEIAAQRADSRERYSALERRLRARRATP